MVEGVEEPRRNDQAREDAIIVSKLINNYISVKKMKRSNGLSQRTSMNPDDAAKLINSTNGVPVTGSKGFHIFKGGIEEKRLEMRCFEVLYTVNLDLNLLFRRVLFHVQSRDDS